MIVIPKTCKIHQTFRVGMGWWTAVSLIYIYDHIYIRMCVSTRTTEVLIHVSQNLHCIFTLRLLKFKHKSWCRAKHGRMDPENVLPKQCYFRAVFQNQTRTLLSQHLQDESSVDACYGHVAGKPPQKKVGIWRCWCRDGTPRNVPQPATPDQTKAVQ